MSLKKTYLALVAIMFFLELFKLKCHHYPSFSISFSSPLHLSAQVPWYALQISEKEVIFSM